MSTQLSFEEHIKKLGGEGILCDADMPSLKAGRKRVFELMRDGAWHTAEEICDAAGENGIPAREGLRRMRELRQHGFFIERERMDHRRFRYRMKMRAA